LGLGVLVKPLFSGSEDGSNLAGIALRYHVAVRWLIDGYNVIRCSPELAVRERESLESGRRALEELLAETARASGDQFIVVFDGQGAGGSASAAGVRVVFSSARESADRVLARMAAQGGAVVSNDRAVRRAATQSGAIALTADKFLATLEGAGSEEGERSSSEGTGPKKGNPHRLGKKARRAARTLRRLGPASRQ
jgi:hypothetical protein